MKKYKMNSIDLVKEISHEIYRMTRSTNRTNKDSIILKQQLAKANDPHELKAMIIKLGSDPSSCCGTKHNLLEKRLWSKWVENQ